MTLEGIYWVALAAGAAVLLLSVLLGDALGFLDFLDFGDGFSLTPVLFTAVAAFGGGGLLALNAFGATRGWSVIAGLGAGIVAGGLAGGLFAMLHSQEAKETFTMSQLVGARGRCTLAIRPGKEGRVSIHHEGMTRSFAATSAEEIGAGTEVVVIDVVGTSLKVAHNEQTTDPKQA